MLDLVLVSGEYFRAHINHLGDNEDLVESLQEASEGVTQGHDEDGVWEHKHLGGPHHEVGEELKEDGHEDKQSLFNPVWGVLYHQSPHKVKHRQNRKEQPNLPTLHVELF